MCVERLQIRGFGSPIRRHSCDLAHAVSLTCSLFDGVLQFGASSFRYLPSLMLLSAEFSYQALPIAASCASSWIVAAGLKAGWSYHGWIGGFAVVGSERGRYPATACSLSVWNAAGGRRTQTRRFGNRSRLGRTHSWSGAVIYAVAAVQTRTSEASVAAGLGVGGRWMGRGGREGGFPSTPQGVERCLESASLASLCTSSRAGRSRMQSGRVSWH